MPANPASGPATPTAAGTEPAAGALARRTTPPPRRGRRPSRQSRFGSSLTTRAPDEEPQPWGSRDWGEVLARLKEHGAAGIDAEGQMTDAMLGDLSRIGHLTALRLGGSKGLTDVGVRHLARLPRLRFLGCQDTVAGDDGFATLSQSRSIEYIWGRRGHNLRTRGCRRCADCPSAARIWTTRAWPRCPGSRRCGSLCR